MKVSIHIERNDKGWDVDAEIDGCPVGGAADSTGTIPLADLFKTCASFTADALRAMDGRR